MSLMQSPSPPKHGPRVELHRIACLLSFEQRALKGLSSLLTKLNIKALGSVTHSFLECHFCSVKPPKTLPLFAFMTVSVLGIPSHFLWKSVDLNPSLDASDPILDQQEIYKGLLAVSVIEYPLYSSLTLNLNNSKDLKLLKNKLKRYSSGRDQKWKIFDTNIFFKKST